MYLYVEKIRGKNGRIYRYLNIEEYLGNGKRKRILRINVDGAIKLLIAWKFEKPLALQGYGAGGGIRTHAGLRQRVLSPSPLTELGHPRTHNIFPFRAIIFLF